MKTTSIYKGNVRFLKEDGVVLEVDTPQGLIAKGMEQKEKEGEKIGGEVLSVGGLPKFF